VKFNPFCELHAPFLKERAHAVLAVAGYGKFGASRLFFARCGIPLL
jgi:hypothetical protein